MKKIEGVFALGIENKLDNGKYLLFMDYDHLDLIGIEQDIQNLYKKYDVKGDLHLFKSEGGYHVYNFDAEFELDELSNLLHKTKADIKFIKCLKWNGENTLRLSPKKEGIKFIKTFYFDKIKNPSKEGQQIKKIVFKLVDYYGKT